MRQDHVIDLAVSVCQVPGNFSGIFWVPENSLPWSVEFFFPTQDAKIVAEGGFDECFFVDVSAFVVQVVCNL